MRQGKRDDLKGVIIAFFSVATSQLNYVLTSERQRM